MSYLIFGLIIIAIVEVSYRCPFASLLRQLKAIYIKAFHVLISKKISDHWKEIVLPSYSIQITRLTINLAGLLVSIVLLFATLSFSFEAMFLLEVSPLDLMVTVSGILMATAFSLAYWFFRSYVTLK